jgi:hypothetical protein
LLVTILNCSIHCSSEFHLGFSESTSHHKTTKPKVCTSQTSCFCFFNLPWCLWSYDSFPHCG